ncbi:methyltransferase [Anaerosacchariphilus polymeriproducens]|uniref:Methyltransferase n=1 Tax=Anaerosacchariphilus polymeriproducens TaxID=1812858 RepID=A0A371AYJ5_9FIRM|nr:methyltransferase [Anaerosacchariphilus polymeriproducens]RDU24665.1 methyltransferase [Anaerosacchariphilus polymeriproducens]
MIARNGLRKIIDTGFAFQQAKVLLAALEFDMFTILDKGGMTGEQIREKLKLHPRGLWDFLDCLLCLGILKRDGVGVKAIYSNSEEAELYLNKKSPYYAGGILELANSRLYNLWDNLTDALKNGKPQNEILYKGKTYYENIYSDPKLTEDFANAMAGASGENYRLLSKKFDFSRYNSLCDIGGSTALLSICVAKEYDNIICTSFDLDAMETIAKKNVIRHRLDERIKIVSGNFLNDPLPKAEIITMGMILHNWNLETKKNLITAVYEALPSDGVFIVIEMMIDDERRECCAGFLQSLNMLLEFGEAFDFSIQELKSWCNKIGFKRYDVINLNGPFSAVIAYK